MNVKIGSLASIAMLGVLIPNMAVQAGDSTSFERGKTAYNETCVACHGEGGKGQGIPGMPDLTKKHGRLMKSDDQLMSSIINGFHSPGSPMEMPPLGGNPDLVASDVADVIVYMRKTFQKK